MCPNALNEVDDVGKIPNPFCVQTSWTKFGPIQRNPRTLFRSFPKAASPSWTGQSPRARVSRRARRLRPPTVASLPLVCKRAAAAEVRGCRQVGRSGAFRIRSWHRLSWLRGALTFPERSRLFVRVDHQPEKACKNARVNFQSTR